MKAIVHTEYGLPEVLQLQEIEKPQPGENEALVAVHAASINSWDWDLLRGDLLNRLIFRGLLKPKLKVLGCDIAGRVEAVGSNVKQLQPGDEVFGDISGCGWGGFAEFVCAREDVLALKPTTLPFDQAAAIPQAGVLALQGLRYKERIQPGQRILVNGAGGGVGTFAVQMIKASGAHVAVVDKGSKLELLRSLGADEVIDYTEEDFTRNGQGYDRILDVVAHRSVLDYKRALNPGGICVIVGGKMASIFQTAFLGPWISMTEGKRIGLLLHKPDRRDLDAIGDLFEAGKVKPIVDRCYPLHQVAEAFRYFGEGQFQGKVVVTVKEERSKK